MQQQMRLKYTLRPLKLQSKVVALLSNRFISAFDKGCQMLQLIVSTNQNKIIEIFRLQIKIFGSVFTSIRRIPPVVSKSARYLFSFFQKLFIYGDNEV